MAIKAMWAKLDPNAKRKVVMVGTIAVLVLVAWGLVAMSQSNDPKHRTSQRPVSHDLLTGHDPRSLGVDGLKAEMDQMKKQIRELLAAAKTNQASVANRPQEGAPGTPGAPGPAGADGAPGAPWAPGASSGPTAARGAAPVPHGAPAEPAEDTADMSKEDRAALEKIRKAPLAGKAPASGQPGSRNRQLAHKTNPRAAESARTRDADTKEPTASPESSTKMVINTYGDKDDEDSGKALKKDEDGNLVETVKGGKAKKNSRFVLPAGSMMEGVLLTGLDAPTANHAKQQPFPVLVRIKHEALLPNRWRSDIRECFIIASAYGDLASERAYLRAEAISCVKDDGTIMESTMDAFATGEDGKNGVRGRLVSKQGAMIAQALMGGFIQGVAGLYKPATIPSLTLNPSNTSTYSRPDPTMAAEEGISGGIQAAGKAVADFYIEMARSTFPIIEVDAGRKVTFVVTRSANVSTRKAAANNDGRLLNNLKNGPVGRGVNQVMNGGQQGPQSQGYNQ